MLNCKKFIYGQKRIKPLPKICLVSSKDRASDSESEGWGFESPAGHQEKCTRKRELEPERASPKKVVRNNDYS